MVKEVERKKREQTENRSVEQETDERRDFA